MNSPATVGPAEIDTLLARRVLGNAHPWNSGDLDQIEEHYKHACACIELTCGAMSRIEWDHYGSGYASFVDAWFYRPDAAFALASPTNYDNEYVGLVVLLNRFSPFYALAQGHKGWSVRPGNAYSYLPSLDSIDSLTVPAVQEIAESCSVVLASYGLRRLNAETLSRPLPPGTRIATNLSGHAYTYFDALFNWDD